jgi:hypothetical protein
MTCRIEEPVCVTRCKLVDFTHCKVYKLLTTQADHRRSNGLASAVTRIFASYKSETPKMMY